MTEETAEKLMDHHKACGSFEFSKSTVQRDEKTGVRYYRYRCVKCDTEFREELKVADSQANEEAA